MPAVRIAEIEGLDDLIGKLRKMGVDVENVTPAALLDGAEVVQTAANREAPGPYIVVGEVEKRGKGHEVAIGPDDEHWYWRFLETGTAPHFIEAYSARALRMGSTGAEYFARSADHPGHAARPFLRPAIDENEKPITDAVGARYKRVLR